jgi:hypothetical protein
LRAICWGSRVTDVSFCSRTSLRSVVPSHPDSIGRVTIVAIAALRDPSLLSCAAPFGVCDTMRVVPQQLQQQLLRRSDCERGTERKSPADDARNEAEAGLLHELEGKLFDCIFSVSISQEQLASALDVEQNLPLL